MFIIHIISNKVWGGGEVYALSLMTRQQSDGHKVLAVTRGIADVDSHISQCGIKLATMPLRGYFDLKSAWRLAKIMRTADMDGQIVIHAHNFSDAFVAIHARRLAWCRKPRIVVTRHLIRKAKTWPPHPMLYRNIDTLIFVSALSRDVFLSSKPRTGKCDIRVIHNAETVPENVQPKDLRTLYGIGDDCVIAMYHGRLAKEKGLETLLEALTMCTAKNIHLAICGSGDEKYVAKINKKIKKAKLTERVTLTGFVKDMAPLIAGCDFGVIPTTAPEAFGLSCVEYMALGKTLLTTDNGAQKEYIRNGENGLLVPPADALALAAAMQLVAAEPSLRQKLGSEALKTVREELNYETFYKEIMNAYTD